ncbi:hypothetical protein GCM10010168_05670 [Actinoplanes ianthinogenes]|uniref:Secreted protein n=1 Tax=Actinoplanes ianthinogenes TaxID=122358 RepID=A0ABM7LTX3_9ACTN|nr:hypothetical protein [Actinoplanes ianthinogenes]BCJ42691.1 hypothetical protein Aiant_33480 [Actinoplanes ianthinogenes]GGQ92871.1 hypothetical protein GCM10010168_05670 [Actinoplanes ianthinogenes]
MTRRWTSRAVVLTASFLALTACDAPAEEPSYEPDVYAANDDQPEDFTVPPTTAPAKTRTKATTAPPKATTAPPKATTEPAEVFYCADQDGVIVDPDLCEDTGEGDGAEYLFWHSPNYPRGLKPGRTLSGGESFARDDIDSRTYYGLPASGVVRNGSTVKSNVIGRSSTTTGSGGIGTVSGTVGG